MARSKGLSIPDMMQRTSPASGRTPAPCIDRAALNRGFLHDFGPIFSVFDPFLVVFAYFKDFSSNSEKFGDCYPQPISFERPTANTD